MPSHQCHPSSTVSVTKFDRPSLYKVAGEQEVGYPLPDGVFVSTVPTSELSLNEVRLHEQPVEICRKLLIGLKGFRRGGLLGECREAELWLSASEFQND